MTVSMPDGSVPPEQQPPELSPPITVLGQSGGRYEFPAGHEFEVAPGGAVLVRDPSGLAVFAINGETWATVIRRGVQVEITVPEDEEEAELGP